MRDSINLIMSKYTLHFNSTVIQLLLESKPIVFTLCYNALYYINNLRI